MKPYYEGRGVTMYNADCRDILPGLPEVDLCLTDPPYGIGMDGGNVGYKGFNNLPKIGWDKKPVSAELLALILSQCHAAIIFGGNYFNLPPSRCWLVWDKGAGFKGRTYAEAELAWTSLDANVRVFSHDPLARGDYKGKTHPTQKPIALMEWCLPFADGNVLDPFLGSGTTAVACVRLNRKCIGIELEEEYCEIAADRVEAAARGITLQEQQDGQTTLFD